MAFGVLLAAIASGAPAADDWQSSFPVDKKTLGVKGSNPYFPLTPGYQLSYEHGNDTDVLTVLNETRIIDGVETRAVEDRETHNGQLAEVTRDYYAIDPATNDVYYFGEDVSVFRNGKIVSHDGSWFSGVKGAKFGLMMPASPKAGQRFYQEQAPGVGMDRAEIISVDEKVATPAGTWTCVHVLETNPLEPGARDHKWYAVGVGQVKDENLVLVRYGKN